MSKEMLETMGYKELVDITRGALISAAVGWKQDLYYEEEIPLEGRKFGDCLKDSFQRHTFKRPFFEVMQSMAGSEEALAFYAKYEASDLVYKGDVLIAQHAQETAEKLVLKMLQKQAATLDKVELPTDFNF
jgi:hypothetical protein